MDMYEPEWLKQRRASPGWQDAVAGFLMAVGIVGFAWAFGTLWGWL